MSTPFCITRQSDSMVLSFQQARQCIGEFGGGL